MTFPDECCPSKKPKKTYVLCRKSFPILGYPQRDYTSPFACLFQHVREYLHARRKWGAVGERAVSCCWEWDKNLFPLPKPTALSGGSVFFCCFFCFFMKQHTENQAHACTDTTSLWFTLKIEKVGARRSNPAGHDHFLQTRNARAGLHECTHLDLCTYL